VEPATPVIAFLTQAHYRVLGLAAHFDNVNFAKTVVFPRLKLAPI
jgi:hypothetical protein